MYKTHIAYTTERRKLQYLKVSWSVQGSSTSKNLEIPDGTEKVKRNELASHDLYEIKQHKFWGFRTSKEKKHDGCPSFDQLVVCLSKLLY